jgi:hypothetical protein
VKLELMQHGTIFNVTIKESEANLQIECLKIVISSLSIESRHDVREGSLTSEAHTPTQV